MRNTKQHILDAAIRVFNEDYSAPLETVAEQAGITRRTLHRYFAGRDELLASCARDLQRSCQQAMFQALASATCPLAQVENMLYAALDCGAKYAFLSKLHTRPERQQPPGQQTDQAVYEALHTRWRTVIAELQSQGSINPQLSIDWIFLLLSGIVSTALAAQAAGTVARQQVRQFAWFSFSKGIGL
ncbi:MAG: TetR/AcrR family transcriptional regulator [Janthinobacterium lividum]